MNYLVSQVFGVAATIVGAASIQCKNSKGMLMWQLIGNLLGAFSYIFVGGLSGSGAYIIGIALSAVLFLFRKKEMKVPRYLVLIFVLLNVGCVCITYKNAADLLAVMAAVAATVALAQEKMMNFRLLAIANGAFWIVYDIFVGAYAMILNHLLTVVSSIVGILREVLKNHKDY